MIIWRKYLIAKLYRLVYLLSLQVIILALQIHYRQISLSTNTPNRFALSYICTEQFRCVFLDLGAFSNLECEAFRQRGVYEFIRTHYFDCFCVSGLRPFIVVKLQLCLETP